MNANSTCIACIIRKQEEGIRHYTDERKKNEYMIRLLEVIAESQGNETSGYLAVQVDKLHREFWGEITDYTEIKHKYKPASARKGAGDRTASVKIVRPGKRMHQICLRGKLYRFRRSGQRQRSHL